MAIIYGRVCSLYLCENRCSNPLEMETSLDWYGWVNAGRGLRKYLAVVGWNVFTYIKFE